MTSTGLNIFKLGFEISPIILTYGIANDLPASMLPIVFLTEAANFVNGILQGGSNLSLDAFFAHFVPARATIANFSFGEYTFANQVVAANAIIANQLSVALRMICPVQNPGGYAAKFATFIALQATLSVHSSLGGTYTVVTPTTFMPNCLLKNLSVLDNGRDKQKQSEWLWEFEQPLITLQSAQGAQNSLMNAITRQTQILGDPPTATGLAANVGNPSSLVAGGFIPGAQSTVGTAAAGAQPLS